MNWKIVALGLCACSSATTPAPGTSDASTTLDAARNDGSTTCVPSVEICGDRVDQNCDGRDTSCGDSDSDGIAACRPGEDVTRCDCDDSRADVRPGIGSLPGATEACDRADNNCNGRIDESAACCSGCSGLADRARADVCNEGGACDCSTASGVGPCQEGFACCTGGCVDIRSDRSNCGGCGVACSASSDRCTAGECRCGSGPVCSFTNTCSAGSCS